jgi:hypothetical protein
VTRPRRRPRNVEHGAIATAPSAVDVVRLKNNIQSKAMIKPRKERDMRITNGTGKRSWINTTRFTDRVQVGGGQGGGVDRTTATPN